MLAFRSHAASHTSFKFHSHFISGTYFAMRLRVYFAFVLHKCLNWRHRWHCFMPGPARTQQAILHSYFIHISFILHLQKGCCHGAAFLFIFVVLRRVNWQRRWHCVMSAPAATLQTILHLNFIHTSFPEHPLLRIRSLSCVGARPIVLCGEEVPLNMFLGMGGMWVV